MLLERLVATGGDGVRVRRLGCDRAGEIRFTRFLRNPAVTVEAMCEAAFVRTGQACRGRDILAVQDTTVTRSNGVGGDYLHAMIAVDAQDGAVFGALDATFCERDTGQRATRHARAFEDKESHRWLAATERAGQITGAARLTMVADREADIYDLFARRPEHVDMIVRANHNRTLDGGDKMADRIAAMPRLGTTQLTLPAIPGRASRAATLSIRFGQMTIKPPKRLEKTTPASIILTYIDLREETPPDGIKPVHWRLLTTYDVTDVIGACLMDFTGFRGIGSHCTPRHLWRAVAAVGS